MEFLLQSQVKLKPNIIARIRKSKHLKLELMIHFNISNSTLQLWLDTNNTKLTQFGSLLILMDHFNQSIVQDLIIIHQIKTPPM